MNLESEVLAKKQEFNPRQKCLVKVFDRIFNSMFMFLSHSSLANMFVFYRIYMEIDISD